MQPCRGITWRAHRDDDRSAEALLPGSSKNQIGSVDPHALKIPARRAECSLTENARSPFHAEPAHFNQDVHHRSFLFLKQLLAVWSLLLQGDSEGPTFIFRTV